MKIAIDLRSLQSGSISGVENYTSNLLDSLLTLDKKNTYALFHNRFGRQEQTLPADNFQFINSRTVKTRYPNRLLNLALMTKMVSLEKFIGDFDVLFMPNLNQFNISPKAKLAITVHDLSPVVTPEFYDFKRNLWHKLLNYRKAFDRANIIFAVSEYTKLDLIRLFGVPEQKIKVVYPGVDRKIFKPDISEEILRKARNDYELPGDYILFLNTVEPRKNLSNLIKAFELLGRQNSPLAGVNLVIAGRPGWKHHSIFRQIKNSKQAARIKFLGYVSEQDKPAIIKLSRMLVYPSFYEGFGFQPLEAQSSGVPTVVSQVTSLPEVVGEASLLVNPYDVSAMAEAMQKLLADSGLRQKLVAKGLVQARKYDWQRTAEQILEGLNSLA